MASVLSQGLFALLFTTTIVYAATKLLADKTIAQFYQTQPFLGKRNEWLSSLRSTFRSVLDTPDRVAEGYTKYGKSGVPFLVSNLRKGPILVIPPSKIKAALSNPENVVEAHAPQFENISAAYTMREPAIYPSNYDVDLVRKQIARRFGSVTKELAEEMSLAFEKHWGTSGEWKSVRPWVSLQDIAAQTVNRVTVGLPLCRNEEYLKRVIGYAGSVVEDGPAIAILPTFLKPILGPLITWRGKRHCEASIKMLLPLVEKRLDAFHANKKGANDGFSPPNDILQWLIEESSKNPDPEQMKPYRIAHRIVMLNFNAAPPAGLTLSHALLDLYSAPEADNFLEILRKECNTVSSQTEEGHWTKEAVERLELLDSTLRESMRHSDFGSLAFPRRIAATGGLDIGGVHVPKGVHMEIPMHNIHMDPDNYDHPSVFNPFRFAGPAAPGATDQSTASKPVVTLDETFMGFGYIRNGCPGRFFAAHLMKSMLAHIIQNYDIEYMKERPKIVTLMEFRFPSQSTTIKIRRRVAKT